MKEVGVGVKPTAGETNLRKRKKSSEIWHSIWEIHLISWSNYYSLKRHQKWKRKKGEKADVSQIKLKKISGNRSYGWIQIVVQIIKYGKVSIVVWSLHLKWTKTKCCIEPSKFHHKIFFLHENYFYMFYSFHFHTSTVVHELSFQLNYSKKSVWDEGLPFCEQKA